MGNGLLTRIQVSKDAYRIQEGAAVWLFKHFLTGLPKAAVKALGKLVNSAKCYDVGALKSYSTITQFLLKRYVTEGNVPKLDAEVHNRRQGSMASTEYAQDLWTRQLSCESVYDKNVFKTLFVDGVTHRIRKALRHCCAKHKHASIEELEQREVSLLDLQVRWQQHEEAMNNEPPRHRGTHRNCNQRRR